MSSRSSRSRSRSRSWSRSRSRSRSPRGRRIRSERSSYRDGPHRRRDWREPRCALSDIPSDIPELSSDMVALIAELTVFPKGLLYFSMVCKSWQSESLPEKSIYKKVLPMVMLPEANSTDIHGPKTRPFYSLATSETYTIELPEASGRKIVPTSYGWLVTVGYDLQINLLHPFSREQVPLPPLVTFKQLYFNEDYKPEETVHFFVNKVTLSKPPRTKPSRHDQEDFVAVAIYGEYRLLAFAKAGDAEWTDIAVNPKVVEDVVYYNNKFYSLDCDGIFFLCDIENENGPRAVQLAPAGMIGSYSEKYLVESSGNLLMVERFRDLRPRETFKGDHKSYHTTKFTIHMLEEEDAEGSKYPYRWTQIQNLDGRALFLGSNVSKSLPPSQGVIKPNCIYFSEFDQMYYLDEPDGGGADTGIFDIEKQTFETHYAANFHCHFSPPMWYL